nr:hypothetical protein [Tanacetum cinerariifolium]
MDDPNITMEEYIWFKEEKANMRVKVYKWETATHGNIWYDEDVYYLRSFKNEFVAIVYKDALQPEPKISSEPMVTLNHVKKVDFDFELSFVKSDDEDYTVIYDNNSFLYKIFSTNDLKSDKDNDNDKIDIEQSSDDLFIKPLPNDPLNENDDVSGVFSKI